MTTSPFDIAIDFDQLEGFTPVIRPLADGLRASTAAECPSCAIIAYLNPHDERIGDFVNTGVATLGHLLHQCWSYQAFRGESHEVEAAIPWEHGVSHDDVIVYSGEWAGVYEVKTHSETKAKAPSAANHRQSQVRMRLRELAGLPTPGPMRLVMIGKAGREGGWVRGPWTVELTDERREEIDAMLTGISSVLARAATLDLVNDPELRDLSNECSRCFPKPTVQPVAGLDGLLGRYITVKRELDEYERQRKTYADAKAALKKTADGLRDQIDPLVPDGVVVEAMSATATRTRAGALVIKDAAEASQNAA